MTIKELLDLLIQSIQRIEQYIGLTNSEDDNTVVGRINNNLEIQYDEKIITSNKFVPSKIPVFNGAWCLNGICQVYDAETKCIYDLDNVLYVDGYFQLDTNEFDGKLVKITYFYKKDKL